MSIYSAPLSELFCLCLYPLVRSRTTLHVASMTAHSAPLSPPCGNCVRNQVLSRLKAFLLFQGVSAAHTVTVLQIRDPNSLHQGTQRTTGASMEPPPQGDAYQPKAAYVPKTLSSLIIPLAIHAHCMKQWNGSNNLHCHIQMCWPIIFPALS